MSIKSVMPSSHLILCRPLLLLPSMFHNIRVFSNESTLLMRWSKYWSFSFSIIPSKEVPGLISFRMDWLDLLNRPSVFSCEDFSSLLSVNTGKKTLICFYPHSLFCKSQEKEMATHSTIFAWRIPMDRGAWQATVHGVTKSWT